MKNNDRKAELTPEENKSSALPEDALEQVAGGDVSSANIVGYSQTNTKPASAKLTGKAQMDAWDLVF